MSEFKGRTAIVTGASRGIGEATARHLAARGANVVLAARSEDAIGRIAREISAAGGAAEAIACDVSRYADVAAAADRARAAFGAIDILVNNAGVIEPIARLAESDPESWGRTIDVNVKGVYHGLRAVLPGMIAAGRGTVVNISSGAAVGALEGWSHYCAGKAAVLSLTRCAHVECAGQGVVVVGMSPGTVATDMQAAIRASGINRVSRLDPAAHIPAEWAARAVAYLCGPGGADHAGGDFSLRAEESRRLLGLPPP